MPKYSSKIPKLVGNLTKFNPNITHSASPLKKTSFNHSKITLSVDLVEAAKVGDEILTQMEDITLKEIEILYKKFFYLASKHPNQALTPTSIIDKMWHLHMLHPVAYNKDCLNICGYIIDHKPSFKKLNDVLEKLSENLQETAILWEKEFCEKYISDKSITHFLTKDSNKIISRNLESAKSLHFDPDAEYEI